MKRKTPTTTVQITVELRNRLRIYAAKRGQKICWIVQEAIEERLKKL